MKIVLIFMMFQQLLMAGLDSLTLNEAIQILQTKNLEIKAATLNVKIAQQDEQSISGAHWGKLDFIQDVARSNDAGNVFGFKLTSREATFGDFGLSEFSTSNPNILNVQPNDLNYPHDRNFFQSKLRYQVPLFTGFALSSYGEIMHSMTKMKSLQKEALINEKTFQLRKSYYNMALLDSSIKNLSTILTNIQTLQNTTQSMIDVGYAKKVDLLEVKAKKGNVKRLLVQMDSNKILLYHYISFLLNQKVLKVVVPKSEIRMPLLNDEEILLANIDIQKATTGLTLRQNMLSVDKALYYPTVGAFGEIATADDTFLGDALKHQAYTVGARLTWNIFNGGSDSAKIQKSKLELLKMQSQVTLAKNGITLQVAKIRTQIKSADEEIKSLTNELELADAIYKNYEGRYREKLTSMNDVIIKQSQQIEKILQLQIAKNRRNEKIFALEKLANTKGY
ncbi:Type I secretion system, outer membrane component LapE [hydrothermal vent metagenome]|uniref:Type I secretion system, outer membrane component LapE n=1 Tax=hydrothermal vent metagenome TaxID=652676 RepID=A0A1W1CQR0_9ZZZZ